MLNFKPAFSPSSFTFIKWFFSSSLSAIRVVSSAYLKLLIFLLTILIPVHASSSLAFHMMYSAYKLNKQGDNIQTALIYSFPNLEPVCSSMSGSNCCFLTCTQLSQEASKMVWYSHLLKNFPQLGGEESRWRRNRTDRSLSLLQIHRKNNRTVKKVYKTTSDR